LDQKIINGVNGLDHVIPLTIENIPSVRRWWRIPVFAAKLTVSFFKSLYYLYKHKPTAIISMGGYVTVPVCLAGTLLRIPIELHELNVEPGKALKFLAPLASTIKIVYPATAAHFPNYSCTHAAYPIRFTPHDTLLTKQEARIKLGLPDKPTLFILGGSQGSLFFNKLIHQWITSVYVYPGLQDRQTSSEGPAIDVRNFTIMHQVGSKETMDWSALYKQHNIEHIVFDFRKDLALLYQAADLIIARAGAGTLAEIIFFNKHAVVIPLEAATTLHQRYNALEMQRMHPALITVMSQKDIEHTPDILFKELNQKLIHL
jgi:UDP-N-acetylglucosamine--N-acetylmuramyl-(pentapeptide) pyrophosphoryl-undecaprenol N-acetylglucosamine transferase